MHPFISTDSTHRRNPISFFPSFSRIHKNTVHFPIQSFRKSIFFYNIVLQIKLTSDQNQNFPQISSSMISGAVPNTTNAPFFNPSKHSSLINNSMFSNSRNLKFPTRKCSVSLKTNAIATERSLYELLEISEEGSFDEIKKAYKQLARKYHPDVSPPDRTEEYTKRFIEVQEAYETLSDPNLRAIYDRDLARGLHLAFSGRRRVKEEYEEKTEWRNKWEYQMDELKRRSKIKMNQNVSDENLSWGARMRRQRANATGS